MKNQAIKSRILLIVLFVTCCNIPAIADDMLELSSALTKLSAAVESTVRYKNPPNDLTDEGILQLSTKHDPELLQPFSGYLVRVKAQDRHAILLVCSKDGKTGLLEDAGCTAKLDQHLWGKDNPLPCEFTLAASSACESN